MKNNGAVFEVDVWSVPVQGKDAIAPIVEALAKAGSMTERYDALVLMRGGGSLEDLAVFNEEYVARALAACEVPTISAIGHERDISICDFVADRRVATPTAAAVSLGEGYVSSGRELDSYGRRLINIMNQKLINSNQRLDMMMNAVNAASPKKRVEADRRHLDHLMKNLGMQTLKALSANIGRVNELSAIIGKMSPKAQIDRKKTAIIDYERRLKDALLVKKRLETEKVAFFMQKILQYTPDRKTEKLRNKIDNLTYRMCTAVNTQVADNKARLAPLNAKLEALDPAVLLSKGYSFVMLGDKPVKSVFDVSLQDELEIRLNDGYINSFVTGKKVSEENNG